ncbi:MAG: aminopeptidase P N-terminal domain-containing protein [Prochlorotrichaceae cyanobacterium]|jgi:Xaa-Pro aminopeptidase
MLSLLPLNLKALNDRRQRLQQIFPEPVLLWSGAPLPRNFRANAYPFRASSHFLYFAGLPLENAVICLADGNLDLYWDEPPAQAALWQALPPRRETIATYIGARAHYPLAELKTRRAEFATLPHLDAQVVQEQTQVLGRKVGLMESERDRALAEAIVTLRLCHDEFGLQEMRQALTVTIAAHRAGMQRSKTAHSEAQVRAAMEGVILEHHCTCAYGSIITTHGEVLHNDRYTNSITPGDLILADVGAETPSGWASDITRTWPASGQFTAPQRDLYQVVLAAHDACIAALQPGVEYREIHLLGCRVLAAGLVELGILRGNPEDLVAQDLHALFFPHGIGHLLGLDVHDMEDLGDLAGYAPNRHRSDRFGLRYLRLDRPLQVGMVVTIEPGFYQVPSILESAKTQAAYQAEVNWDRLADFASIRGIRIEDDVLITAAGSEVLSAALPTTPEAIEGLCTDEGI